MGLRLADIGRISDLRERLRARVKLSWPAGVKSTSKAVLGEVDPILGAVHMLALIIESEHDRTIEAHRNAWPSLWAAIDDVLSLGEASPNARREESHG